MKAAIIVDSNVINIVDTENLNHPDGLLMIHSEVANIGDLYENGQFSKPPIVIDLLAYKAKRAAEYPPMTDYLDGIVKGDTSQVQAYIDACLAVKLKYPKP